MRKLLLIVAFLLVLPAAAPAAAPMTVDLVLLPSTWPAIAPMAAPVATFCTSLLFGWLRTFSIVADSVLAVTG
jgi:hypothetical protein